MSELTDRLRTNVRNKMPQWTIQGEAADEIEQLTRERDEARADSERERRYSKEYVNCISQIYQIADGPNRDVQGNEIEAVRELRRERDEAREAARQLLGQTETFEDENEAIAKYPWLDYHA
jgi:hypothetical protein